MLSIKKNLLHVTVKKGMKIHVLTIQKISYANFNKNEMRDVGKVMKVAS